MIVAETRTKTCTKCGQTLPVDRFGKVRADRTWLRSKCNACESKRISSYRKELRHG